MRGLLHSVPTDALNRESELAQLRSAGFTLGVDTDPALLVHGSLAEGVVNAVAAHHPSLVLVTQRSAAAAPAFGTAGEAVAATIPSPVAIVIGEATKIGEVRLVETHSSADHPHNGAIGLAEELASRIAGKNLVRQQASELPSTGDLRPEQVCIAAVSSWEMLAASDPPEGAALIFVLQPAGDPSTSTPADAELRIR